MHAQERLGFWGFRVLGFGGLGFRVLGFWGFGVLGLSFWGLGFRVLGLWGLGFRAVELLPASRTLNPKPQAHLNLPLLRYPNFFSLKISKNQNDNSKP